MRRADQREIWLRLVVAAPVPGVALSLQGKGGLVVDAVVPGSADVVFSVPLRAAFDAAKGRWRFYGDFVRNEGPGRQFIYVGVGEHAGQLGSPFDRRMKIDIHDIPASVVGQAVHGAVIEGVVAGTGLDGTPACATVPLLDGWRAG
jgi:hypothetical protein